MRSFSKQNGYLRAWEGLSTKALGDGGTKLLQRNARL